MARIRAVIDNLTTSLWNTFLSKFTHLIYTDASKEAKMTSNAKSTAKKPSASARAMQKAAPVRASSGGRIVGPLPLRFDQVFLTPPHERVDAIKRGVPAKHINVLARRMDVAKETLMSTLRLSRATVDRKARDNKALSQDESERVLGVEYLIGQVENMVKESGNPEGFDAAKWVSSWLDSPLPALGGRTPASYMDTVEGQKLVSNLLATAQSGAYA
jgi:putative toxin-antitoxin system antitoxin component (TIGR02293 family)